MANSYLSANMALVIPVPGTDPGPDWANNLNASLTIIDSHNHALGSGVQINPAGININADLPLNSNNLLTARSIRLDPQGVPLALADDLGCLYESGVDLYYNDGAGNQIRITQSGSVAGSTGTITGLPSGTASAAFASGSGTFVFQQATSTGANLDVGSIAIRYPGSYPTPSGNYIQLQAPTSLASGYSLTLPAIPASNNTFLSISTAGVIAASLTVDNSTLAISGSNVVVKSGGITSTQLAAGSVGTSQLQAVSVTLAKMALQSVDQSNIAVRSIISPASGTATNGAIQVTATCGNFQTASTGGAQVTNLLATVNTAGNPVQIKVISDGDATSGHESQIVITGSEAIVSITRNGSNIASYGILTDTVTSVVQTMDFPPAGTYTYRIILSTLSGASPVSFKYAQLIVYEMK